MSKRIFAMTFVLALGLTAPFAAAEEKASTDAAKGPKLTLVEPLKDFGTVAKGSKLEWAFEVRNTGTTDLEIISAKPTCGCTVADFDKVIKPGKTGKLSANVDTTNFSGPIAKSVTLETNDANAPTAQVTITAIVKPFVDAYPAGFVRYNMLQGDVEKQTVLLYSEDETPLEIVKVESPQEWISVDVKKAEGADVMPKIGRVGQNQYKVDITVGGPDARVGPLAEKVKILTNSKNQPEYSISVSGVVRPTFRVEPTGVNFGEITPADTAATRTVMLRSNNLKTPENFVVTKAESGVAGVTAAVKPTANKGEYEVTLQIAKDAKVGALDGSVLIQTNDKVKPTVTIPIKGTVKTVEAAATGASK
ncbi:MAG TPA: DUF1573 domain-containing protein [Thermoanaerobaculia bacterium]|nr:DUF1573 domain-containing protein [Thermoanaerobaculia bacterium]